eukprot:scaffold17980_cov77-Isochrysis_galbana.AAC.5
MARGAGCGHGAPFGGRHRVNHRVARQQPHPLGVNVNGALVGRAEQQGGAMVAGARVGWTVVGQCEQARA